ncbi:MAG: dihydrolipoamide dehydrogenase [Candidatus Margulisiibacteriota bacterium]|nr:MAG: hypothetical protein A2X43_03130 [Candidatus Margulisbacteria bacterium GWD2_39_127]PZM79606.1 MAG: dihydrolipoamide dehydrogenase [Candidatus Margulisiibacteriota bacterium]HAR63212.1 dihydrolipoamide dehydrogenase [Candidatus Margulisiibacteriota bacterium]HCY37288.1 dihydrolipoamide dehydrogenase [Candidatus Margulisiibacteriota bacterium]
MKIYDLIVVGSGVGLTVLSEGIDQGLECALIESGKMGGTCLTRGCIPSKILTEPADIIRQEERAKKIGLSFEIKEYDWDLIAQRMWSQIDESKAMNESLSSIENLTVYRGVGEFTDEYRMKVRTNAKGDYSEEFVGKKILLTSGARPVIPYIEGIEQVGYVTYETFFGDKFPRSPWNSLILIGGGTIAVEFAHILSAFGTDITIVEMKPRLVSTEEELISRKLEEQFIVRGMNVFTTYRAVSARIEEGMKVVTVEDTLTAERIELEAEEIFIAAGLRSNADVLNVNKTGVHTDNNGWIVTNEYLETSKQNIWAFGDANGKYQFRHKANMEASICMQNMFGTKKIAVDYSSVPWAVFSDPQIGHVGMTEEEAIAKGHKIYVAENNYSSVAKGFAMGLEPGDYDDGYFKLIIDRSYKILGAHAIGPEAALLVQPFVYLMNAGYTCEGLIQKRGRGVTADKLLKACPGAGTFLPLDRSMVIHPSLNEVAGWAIGNLRSVNIPHEHAA